MGAALSSRPEVGETEHSGGRPWAIVAREIGLMVCINDKAPTGGRVDISPCSSLCCLPPPPHTPKTCLWRVPGDSCVHSDRSLAGSLAQASDPTRPAPPRAAGSPSKLEFRPMLLSWADLPGALPPGGFWFRPVAADYAGRLVGGSATLMSSAFPCASPLSVSFSCSFLLHHRCAKAPLRCVQGRWEGTVGV